MKRRPAVFFDRDGVLNLDHGYVHRPEDFHWSDGAMAAIKYLNERDWLVFVVTNQSGVARGYYGEDAVLRLHAWMQAELARRGAHVDAFYYCPHHPDGEVAELAIACDCRKPEPGMLLRALAEWPVDSAASLLLGDRVSDLEAAHRAGVRGVLYPGGDLLACIRRLVEP